ncbi:hypothetical protein I8748_29815, partial [Nostoc sp. CENA67]
MSDNTSLQSSSVLDPSVSSPSATKSSLDITQQPQINSLVAASDSTSSQGNGLYAEYYDNKDFTNLKLTRIDNKVDFNWASGSPDSSIGADTFSVRWTGQVQAQYSETYNFYTTTDDGVRLWVDGKQIINSFVNQAAKEISGTIALVAGQKYDIKLEYYENTGQAVAKLAWSSASTAKQIIPQSQLYSDTDFTPPSATVNAATLTTRDGNSYTFTVTYSDVTAVDVTTLDNNDIVVTGPNGFSQSATLVSVDSNSNSGQRTATYSITSLRGEIWSSDNNGTYTIALQANQVKDTRGNSATAAADIGSFQVNIAPNTGIGTGLKGEYYDNIDFTNLKLTRTDSKVDFNWGSGSPNSSIGADTFSVRWTGQVQAQYSETYNFYTTTDDGVRLWVDGKQIINNFVNQAAKEISGTIALVAGQKYDIKLEYYENAGQAVAKLAWSSASTAKQIIPQSQLYLPALAPTITLGSSVTTVKESAGNVIINVVRSGEDLSGTSSVRYATTSVSATPGSDYGTKDVTTEVTGRVTFEAGETSKQISIPILNDSIAESDETLTFVVDQVEGADLGLQRTLTVTIEDDDRTDLDFTQPQVKEDAGTVQVTVTRNYTGTAASVDYTTVDDTAKAGLDYTAISGTLNFAVGESSKTINISIQDDTVAESNEQFSLKFSNAIGVGLGQDTA